MAENTSERSLPLGSVYATPGALRMISSAGQDWRWFLQRHERGDWGVVDKEDWESNDWSLENNERILSAYLLANKVKIWIITEWDRSATTILLPDEY